MIPLHTLTKTWRSLMNLKQLEYLMMIEKKRNLTAASEKLYISQPSLSQFLTKTEAELGFPIFRRVSNQMLPTIAGQKYLDCARNILGMYADTMSELMDFTENNYGELSIGFTIERGSMSLHKIYEQYHRLFPNIHLQYHEGNTQELEEMTASGQLDLAICSGYHKHSECTYTPLVSTGMALGIRDHHPALESSRPLFTGDHLDLSALSGYPCILTRKGTQARRITDALFRREKLQPIILLETYSVQTMCNLVSVSDAYAFMAEIHIRPIENIRFCHIPQIQEWNICVITKNSRPVNKAMECLIQVIKDVLNEEMQFRRSAICPLK